MDQGGGEWSWSELKYKYQQFKQDLSKKIFKAKKPDPEKQYHINLTKHILRVNPFIFYSSDQEYHKKRKILKKISPVSIFPESFTVLSGFYFCTILFGKYTGVANHSKLITNFANNIFQKYWWFPFSLYIAYKQKYFNENYFEEKFAEEIEYVQNNDMKAVQFLFDKDFVYQKLLSLHEQKQINPNYVKYNPNFVEYQVSNILDNTSTKQEKPKKRKKQQQKMENQSQTSTKQEQDEKEKEETFSISEKENQNYYFQIDQIVEEGGLDDDDLEL